MPKPCVKVSIERLVSKELRLLSLSREGEAF